MSSRKSNCCQCCSSKRWKLQGPVRSGSLSPPPLHSLPQRMGLDALLQGSVDKPVYPSPFYLLSCEDTARRIRCLQLNLGTSKILTFKWTRKCKTQENREISHLICYSNRKPPWLQTTRVMQICKTILLTPCNPRANICETFTPVKYGSACCGIGRERHFLLSSFPLATVSQNFLFPSCRKT